MGRRNRIECACRSKGSLSLHDAAQGEPHRHSGSIYRPKLMHAEDEQLTGPHFLVHPLRGFRIPKAPGRDALRQSDERVPSRAILVAP